MTNQKLLLRLIVMLQKAIDLSDNLKKGIAANLDHNLYYNINRGFTTSRIIAISSPFFQ